MKLLFRVFRRRSIKQFQRFAAKSVFFFFHNHFRFFYFKNEEKLQYIKKPPTVKLFSAECFSIFLISLAISYLLQAAAAAAVL